MKKIFVVFGLFFLVGCQKSEMIEATVRMQEYPPKPEVIEPIFPEIQEEVPEKEETVRTEIPEMADLPEDVLPQEAREGMEYLEKLGFQPFLFQEFLPFCEVNNGTVCYTGYFSDQPNWTGDILQEDGDFLEVFSEDLVYFQSETGLYYQLGREGYYLLED